MKCGSSLKLRIIELRTTYLFIYNQSEPKHKLFFLGSREPDVGIYHSLVHGVRRESVEEDVFMSFTAFSRSTIFVCSKLAIIRWLPYRYTASLTPT